MHFFQLHQLYPSPDQALLYPTPIRPSYSTAETLAINILFASKYFLCIWCTLLLVLLCFDSRPRTKQQKYGTHENEGLSGMLKLCTAVMRHDPSFKMSPDGLVSDVFLTCVMNTESLNFEVWLKPKFNQQISVKLVSHTVLAWAFHITLTVKIVNNGRVYARDGSSVWDWT